MSPYSLSKFVSLRFFASRNSCLGIAALFVQAISTEHKVFKTFDKSIRYYVITHPSPRLPVSPVSSCSRIMHGQGVLFNRAAVPTAVSPETSQI